MQSLTIFKEISCMQLEGASQEALQMYNEIKDFIYSGVWSKSVKTKEMLPLMNESAGLIANRLGLSKTNVLASRSQASEKLRKILGKNLSSNILSNDLAIYENFRYRMQCAVAETLSNEEILFPEIIDRLNAFDTDKVFDLQECEKEIDFLSELSIPRVLYKLDTLDREKLDYILGVLHKPSHYKIEKGSRVKNDAKYQVIGKILYLADKDEFQQLREELSKTQEALTQKTADFDKLRNESERKLRNARNRIAELEAQVKSLSDLDL